MEKQIKISYQEYEHREQLSPQDFELLKAATQASENAYAPYSKFRVGAAVRLANGITVLGNNQENAAYPSGLCAERVAIFSAAANYPGVPMLTMAITATSEYKLLDHPLAPCGACRQVLIEYEHRYHQKTRIILAGKEGPVYIFESMGDLLPIQFLAEELG